MFYNFTLIVSMKNFAVPKTIIKIFKAFLSQLGKITMGNCRKEMKNQLF